MSHESTTLWSECAEDGTVLRGSDDAMALFASLSPALTSLAPYIARRPDVEAAFRRREGKVRLGLRQPGERLACEVEISEGSRGSLRLALTLLPLSREPGVADSLSDWAMVTRDGVAVCDPDAHVLFANPAFCALVGLNASEMFGRDLYALTVAAERGEDDEPLRRALFVTGAWRGDRLLLRADGGSTLVELALTAFGGPPTRQIVALCRDIGDQREREALALAEAMTGTTARLASGISHDVNNLAAEMVVWAEEALASDDPEELREALRQEMALGLAAGEVGQQLQRLAGEPGESGPVDLGVVLHDLAWLLERASKRVRPVRAEIPSEPLAINASGVVLRSLVLVLAMRLLGEGDSPVDLWADEAEDQVRLHLRCAASREEGERLRRLFPGNRVVSPLGNALSVRAMAAGLSLSMGIDEEQVTLTVSGRAVRARHPSLAPAPEQSAARYGRALVAEDNEQLRGLIVRALEPIFADVIATGNGEEALDALIGVGGAVDVLVTDVMMPRLGGAELVARARERWPELRCVFTSGLVGEEVLLRERTGRERFLRKPFKLAALRGAVDELLNPLV